MKKTNKRSYTEKAAYSRDFSHFMTLRFEGLRQKTVKISHKGFKRIFWDKAAICFILMKQMVKAAKMIL